MLHDQLFLLRADFADPAFGPGAYHCTDCARIEGLLSYFPRLRTQLDVTYVDLPRPRGLAARRAPRFAELAQIGRAHV